MGGLEESDQGSVVQAGFRPRGDMTGWDKEPGLPVIPW